MTERKSISKTIRFEIFKRDSFTCQYCGKGAPEVILEVDHIMPVSKGGDNDITNLITSCFDCNRGKTAKKLDDNIVMQKRKSQLDDLQKKREQLEMLMQWQRGLLTIEKQEGDEFAKFWTEICPGSSINESGAKHFVDWRKKYQFSEILEAAKISVKQYVLVDKDGKLDIQSAGKAFDYIPKICYGQRISQSKPYLRDLYYIRGILKNRFSYCNDWKAIQFLEAGYKAGIEIEMMKDIAKTARNWTEWTEIMQRTIEAENG